MARTNDTIVLNNFLYAIGFRDKCYRTNSFPFLKMSSHKSQKYGFMYL